MAFFCIIFKIEIYNMRVTILAIDKKLVHHRNLISREDSIRAT